MREILTNPTSMNHIPLRGFFPPGIRKKHKSTKLITVRVHKACNESYLSDEEYFIYSLYRFALGTYVGNEMHKHIREKFRAGKIESLSP
jgi:hypothetical protein